MKYKLANVKYLDLTLILILIFISYFIIFNRLGIGTLFAWDESRNAQNALEILKSNDWIVLKYGGTPDLWNLKPPLFIWLLALGFKLFGISEATVRIWSALFALGTIIIIYFFGILIKDRFVGFIGALSLLLNPNFVGFHSAISGDVDTAVTFFITLSLYLFFCFTKNYKPRFLILTAIPLSLSFLTKGAVGIIPILIILAYLLLTSSIKKVFTRYFFYSILLFVILTFPWFIVRYLKNPDYFQVMIQQDVITRINTAIEGHVGDSQYYLKLLNDLYGIGFYYIGGIILFTLLIFKKDRVSLFLIIWFSVILIIFTVSQTKIPWYIIPVYPAISLCFGYTFNFIYQLLKSKFPYPLALFPMIFFLIYNIPALLNSFYIYVNPLDLTIKSMRADLQRINNIFILEPQINQSTFFYLNSSIKGKVKAIKDLQELHLDKNDAVIALNEQDYQRLREEQEFKIINYQGYVALFQSR